MCKGQMPIKAFNPHKRGIDQRIRSYFAVLLGKEEQQTSGNDSLPLTF